MIGHIRRVRVCIKPTQIKFSALSRGSASKINSWEQFSFDWIIAKTFPTFSGVVFNFLITMTSRDETVAERATLEFRALLWMYGQLFAYQLLKFLVLSANTLLDAWREWPYEYIKLWVQLLACRRDNDKRFQNHTQNESTHITSF